MEDIRATWRRVTLTLSWHRRLLAGGLAAGAMALAIAAASPDPPNQVEVVVAAHDLDGGITLTADDLTTARIPPGSVPDGVLARGDIVAATLAGPVRAGEPITDRRLLTPELIAGWGGNLVAAPVRLADPGSAHYLRHGDRVDLLATAVDGVGGTTVVASDVPVLALPPPDADANVGDGALVMVAASPDQATRLADAAVHARLSFTVGNS